VRNEAGAGMTNLLLIKAAPGIGAASFAEDTADSPVPPIGGGAKKVILKVVI